MSKNSLIRRVVAFIVLLSASSAAPRPRRSNNSEFAADLCEFVERELQFVARVSGSDDRPDARFVARDRRERDALGEDAFVEQTVRQLHGARAFADDHRRDRALAEAGVEAEPAQAGLEEP